MSEREARVFKRVVFAGSIGVILSSLAYILKWPQYDTLAWWGLGTGPATLIALLSWRDA